MRRVVTGHRNGKAVVLEDAELEPVVTPIVRTVHLGVTGPDPEIPPDGPEAPKETTFSTPVPGGTRCHVGTLPPDDVVIARAKEKGMDVVAWWEEHFHDAFGMHATDTIDYDIILSGECWLELDDGAEVHLKAGDCVILNGTRHAWRNRSNEDCVMATVMVGATRVK